MSRFRFRLFLSLGLAGLVLASGALAAPIYTKSYAPDYVRVTPTFMPTGSGPYTKSSQPLVLVKIQDKLFGFPHSTDEYKLYFSMAQDALASGKWLTVRYDGDATNVYHTCKDQDHLGQCIALEMMPIIPVASMSLVPVALGL